MKTTFKTIDELIINKSDYPFNISDIPNHMGINLCAVDGISWTKLKDGQLVSLQIHFIPEIE